MEKKSIFSTVKSVITLVSAIGVGKVVDDIIENALPTDVKLPVKIFHKIGSYCLSWVVADWATERLEGDLDVIEVKVGQLSERIAEVTEEVETETIEREGEKNNA